ncbi:MAG: AraC family transcriptional regulator, partial [Nannocystaceae bacterium]|nr:AraC family transcriptional regulator [Nannocystaceae bacterium]
ALLDDVRQEMLQGLREQDVPVEDIAYRLGYTDMGSFRRALRRWER